MKKVITLAAILLMAVTPSAGQNINADKSLVDFKIRNMRMRDVTGTFKGMAGTVKFNPDNLQASDFDVCITPATVNTDNKKRDEHLQGGDFFDVSKHPGICFRSSQVSKAGNGYTARGKLTMFGVTKEVEMPFTFENNTFKGTLNLKRLDYKVGEKTGTFMVGDDVEIHITCVLN